MTRITKGLLAALMLVCVAAGPATAPTTQPEAVQPAKKPLASIEQIFTEMPKDNFPSAGQKWDGLFVNKENDWLSRNVVGRSITFKAVFSETTEARRKLIANVRVSAIRKAGLDFSVYVIAFVDPDNTRGIEKLRHGQTANFNGTITEAKIDKDSHLLTIVLKDSGVVK